jgi:hypothetical protein
MADPDPIDRAYRDAETLLQEQAERSARRARVLAAVAQDSDRASRPNPAPRSIVRGGWLAAASVLIVSGFLVTRFSALQKLWLAPPTAQAPATIQKNQVVAALSKPAPPIVQPDIAMPKIAPPDHAPAIARAPAESSDEQTALPVPPAIKMAPPPEMMVAPAVPPPLAEAAPPPPPAMAAPPMPAPFSAAPSAAARSDMAKPMQDPDFDQLRNAAAAGRKAEVQHLLDRHVPVDAADPDGETALMKSIRADQPATAALLIRHGASLDKKNNAGLSPRDLAAQIKDSALNHALGLEP